uniref:Tyrosine-protein phosphatase domain-containing protein n=1 Tax=Loa loa TaxID=7209 RepID=A0A1I7W3R4_LOALO
MVDTIQTKEGAIAISAENMRISMRSVRRAKTKMILTPAALISHLKANGRKLGEGIADLYQNLEKDSPTFFAFFSAENRAKNKFPNGDSAHFSIQAKQYVLAQAPFDETTAHDFFRLVMQCKPEVIIVLMDLDPDDNEQYITASKPRKYGTISVRNEKREKPSLSKESTEKYSHYKLVIMKEKEKEGKIEQKYQLITLNTWTNDMIIPKDDFVKFHKVVHKQLENQPRECSQLVVCPSGAHRAGVWAVFDTEAERLKTKNRIRFSDTVNLAFH